MPSPFPKKKGVGGATEPELEPPEPLDSPTKKPAAPRAMSKQTISVSKGPPAGAPPVGGMGGPPPNGAPPMGGPPMGGMGAPPPGAMGAGGGDYGEDFGQKLAADIDAVSQASGMSTEQGRAFAANLLGVMADCLARAAGGGGGGEEPGSEGTEDVTETEEEEVAY